MILTHDTAADLVHEIFDLQRVVRCLAAAGARAERTGVALHFVLRIVGEGECRATRLAERLGIGAPVLSRQIAELEDHGLVVRRKDPDDGRAQLVALTSSGADKLRRMEGQRSAVFQEYLRDWTEDDAVHVAKALHQLTQSLKKSARTPGTVTT
jgi:DNA-binding MarR family transcriptional regulator